MSERVFKDTRLLEALEFIDDEYIASAARYKMKYEAQPAEPPKMTWRTPFKHWRQFVALAACILLLSVASPLVSYIAEVISNFNAGAGSGTTEELNTTEYTDPVETEQSFTTESIETEQPIDTTAEHTLIPYQYVVSREEFDEMTEAWKVFRNNERAYITRTYEEFSYYYPCQGFNCVYKKEADVVVFCKHSAMTWYGEMTVAGYLFKLPSMEEIWVYKNKEFYSLSQAYELGILNEEDIKELSEIHHEHLYGENRFG